MSNFTITELKQEYVNYVIDIVMKRWNESEENALQEVKRWLHNRENSICFIGIIDGKPIATGVLETHSTVDESIPCWNTLLWVEPQYRGNGYGILISEIRFKYAKNLGYQIVYLDTIDAKDYHLKTEFGWKIFKEFNKNGEYYTIMYRSLM